MLETLSCPWACFVRFICRYHEKHLRRARLATCRVQVGEQCVVATVDAIREPRREIGLVRRIREDNLLKLQALRKSSRPPSTFDGFLKTLHDFLGQRLANLANLAETNERRIHLSNNRFHSALEETQVLQPRGKRGLDFCSKPLVLL